MYATLAFLAAQYPIMDACWHASGNLHHMEVIDEPNECDQAVLGSPHHFICYMWMPWKREPTRYADDLTSQKCDTDTQLLRLWRNEPMKNEDAGRMSESGLHMIIMAS